MTITFRPDGGVDLIGSCDSEDAEALLRQLIANPSATVDWTACDHVHTAIVQVLFVAGVIPVGPPLGQFLMDMVEPLLKGR